jgi:carbamoyl-phosphate synthase large subunit
VSHLCGSRNCGLRIWIMFGKDLRAMDTIIVTGVGGGVGQSILKSLQGSGYRVVGVDADATATGLYAVDRAYRIPRASSSDFVDRLIDIARSENASLIFPGLDPELPVFAASAQRFRAQGVQVAISDPEVVRISDDKLATTQFLEANGFPSPRTCLLRDALEAALPYPVVLKPRTGGSRSQGVFIAHTPDEVRRLSVSLPAENYVAQELITGDEYTCGSVNFHGRCYGVITMRRILRDGDTYKAFVHKDPNLSSFVASMMEALEPFGACNTQLRVRDGVPYTFEFNARSSGTTYCRSLAGFNEPVMIANYLLRNVEPRSEPQELTIFRYWKEMAIDNARIAAMTQSGEISGNAIPL